MREPLGPGAMLAAPLATAALVVGAAALSGCEGKSSMKQAATSAPAPTVTVVRAGKMDVPLVGHPTGTTRALNQVTIRARIKGFLREQNFTEGQNVKKGQLLLVIEEKPFEVKVQQAKGALEEAQAGLKKAKETRAREIAAAQVALDETQQKLDEVEERRERNLLARKASSQEDYDRARTKAEKSKAQVDASKASLSQALADYDINILAAESKVVQAQADLEASQIDLGYCRMIAPIDGRIGELQVKLGNLVGPAAAGGINDTTTLVTIEQLDPMGVDLRPASRYLPFVTRLVSARVPFTLRVQGRTPHPQEGRLSFIDNTIDTRTSTVLVKGEVPNPGHSLLPGEYVKVDMRLGEYAGSIVVPEQAVVETQEGFRAMVVDDQDKIRESKVKMLDTYQGLAVLESGVKEGERVVVEGIQLVRPGQTVKGQEAELSRYRLPGDSVDEWDTMGSPLLRFQGSEPTDTGGAQPSDAPPPPARKDTGDSSTIPTPEKAKLQPAREP